MSSYEDQLYLDLLGARERLCRAQTHVPVHWLGTLQDALNCIDLCASSVVPSVWSKHNQPEYGGESE